MCTLSTTSEIPCHGLACNTRSSGPYKACEDYPMNHQLPTSSNHTNHMHIIPSVPSYFHTTVSCLISSLHRCGRKIICLSRLGTGERSHPEFPGRTPVSLDSTNGIKSTTLMVMILRWSLWWYYRCFCIWKNDSLKHSWHSLYQTYNHQSISKVAGF